MKVILVENIDRLGKIGDVVSVKEGYARNFLFPQKKAKVATEGNVKLLEALKKKQIEEEKKHIQVMKTLAEKIGALSLTIRAQAGEEEKLFGSVSSEMIAEALKAENITIDKKDIIIDEPIKKLGIYTVQAKLHPEVKASVKVWVVNLETKEEK